jgi:hypothetical protein
VVKPAALREEPVFVWNGDRQSNEALHLIAQPSPRTWTNILTTW